MVMSHIVISRYDKNGGESGELFLMSQPHIMEIDQSSSSIRLADNEHLIGNYNSRNNLRQLRTVDRYSQRIGRVHLRTNKRF